MLRVRDPVSGAITSLGAIAGEIVRVGFVLASDADELTCTRVLVIGDLLCRILEDLHSTQVLTAVIADDRTKVDRLLRSGLMVRPVCDVFCDQPGAETGLSKPLDLLVTGGGRDHETALRRPTLAVAPARCVAQDWPAEPTTLRFALAKVPYAWPLDVTDSLLERCERVVESWRDRVAQWSRHASCPIPSNWRGAAIAALDDDLDVARLVAMMHELDRTGVVEPGAKFEAFAYLDRVLAVDLMRNLGRVRR
jgi:hypothetical protein